MDAFEAVVGARQESEAKIRQAEGYAARTLALARGTAVQTVRQAEAYKFERVASSEAQAAQFRNQMMAYNAAPQVYLNRAYLQPWMHSSTNARLFIVTSTNTHDIYQLDLQEKINLEMTDVSIPSPTR